MQLLQRVAAWLVLALGLGVCAGCSAPASLLIFAYERSTAGEKDPTCLSAGCMSAAILQHAYDKYTEGDPTPCARLNSVARALSGRCGAYVPGSLAAADVVASELPRCPLILAARDPKLWPLLPELLAKGAAPELCEQAPLAALARAQPCPDFTAASPAERESLRWLAEADAQAVQHDVVRLLSCPSAQAAGLSRVLDAWLAQGLLPVDGLMFSPLGALHPQYLGSSFARALEARGHTAAAALGHYAGQLPGGFELALRGADRAALDWWFARVPALVNRVPANHAGQLPWLPLARVITPGYLVDATQQAPLVAYLIARGADPMRPLPHDPQQSVIGLARQLDSPVLAALAAGAPRTAARGEGDAALAANNLPRRPGGGFVISP